MSAEIVTLAEKRGAKTDNGILPDFVLAPTGQSGPVWIAEARLADTPDLPERLAWARRMVNVALRDLRSKQEWRRARAYQGSIATAFLILGHAIGIRHPEVLFDQRRRITEREIAELRNEIKQNDPIVGRRLRETELDDEGGAA